MLARSDSSAICFRPTRRRQFDYLRWSLLRDVPFTDYETNGIAIAAAEELTRRKDSYVGPKDNSGRVTPRLLFRGGGLPVPGEPLRKYFPGEHLGPYISQFCIRPTRLGLQPIDQKIRTLAEDVDYLTNLDAWHAIQNGVEPLTSAKPSAARRLMNHGRALAAFTHVDELYQAYLTAYLVLDTLKINKNPTPTRSGTKNGSSISVGGIVHLMKTGLGNTINPQVDHAVLDSKALQQSQLKFGSFLLSRAFPEGSPCHPAYPTGHGTVAGACITVLKFFFDGDATIPNPMFPSKDGQTLEPYNGSDKLTVNGELHKLAHNISFGHGIHAGIHWRSDTDCSLLLGEAVALSFLQDQAFTYQEEW